MNYNIQATIHESANSLIYRARRAQDNLPVILKVLKEPDPAPEYIGWFTREYEILHELNIPGAPTVYGLETHQGHLMMILEDFGGESLTHLGCAGRLTVEEFLRLAITLTDILGQIHQQHIIHRDINPSNIVYNAATNQVKIIDFGIASVLPRETLTFVNTDNLEGTLAYISPEQTGRMNTTLDYRTDLYSLGVTFYELLVGDVPFWGDDALELVHSHIARKPVPPVERQPAIPRMLSDIVTKLMAKNAEERYQSTYGLKTDLERCLHQWEEHGQIEPFSIGQNDVSDQFLIPQKLYGREQEIATVLAAFDRISTGSSEVLLISGDPGIGKSALAQEVYKPVTRQRGYYITGKFEQLQRNIPYSAVIQAFRTLVQFLLSESEEAIEAYRASIMDAVGPNGQVILDVLPELELIIGPQPPVPMLGPTEAHHRFNLVFQRFVQVFARPEHPLVVFLDDLQWADQASLRLLEQLTTDAESDYLLIIGTYRDTEIDAGHPLQLTIDAIKQAGTTLNMLLLAPLEVKGVVRLVMETLSCDYDTGRSLADLLMSKTGGNPFFLNEFLKSLHGEGLVTFNYETSRWVWSLEHIQAREITDNVVDLMTDKMRQLSPESQEVLKLAACIGNHFDLATLAQICEHTAVETARILEGSLKEGFLLPVGQGYKLMVLDVPDAVDGKKVVYKFAHDRVHQAVYSLMPADENQAIHWHIGQLLREALTEAEHERSDQLFDVVNQLNAGRSLIASQQDWDRIIHLNMRAGRAARNSAAYEAAFTYFQTGIALLEHPSAPGQHSISPWQEYYDLTLSLYVETAEAAYLSGNLADMESLTALALEHAETVLDKVKIYDVQLQARVAQNRLQEAISTALFAANMVGASFPEQPGPDDVTTAFGQTQQALADRAIEDLLELPGMTDPYYLACMRILSRVTAAAFGDPLYFALIVLKQVEFSMRYGNAIESPFPYAAYGLMLCGSIGDIDAGYRFGQLALNLLEKFNAREIETRTRMAVNFTVRHWKEPARQMLPSFMKVYQSGLETGDPTHACYSLYHGCYMSYLAGIDLQRMEQEAANYSQAIAHLRQDVALNWQLILQQVIQNLLGHSDNRLKLQGEAFDEDVMLPRLLETGEVTSVFLVFFHKLTLAYLFEDYITALSAAEQAMHFIQGAVSLPYIPLLYMYDSLVRLTLFPEVSDEEKQRFQETIAANQQKLQEWAHHAPENNQHRYHLVAAELARVQNNEKDAWEHYNQATTLARQHEYTAEEALAHEHMARFYLARRQPHFAEVCLRQAYQAYKRWGAVTKLTHLERTYPQLHPDRNFKVAGEGTGTFASVTISTSERRSTASVALDIEALKRVSEVISGGMVLGTLLSRIISVVIENAGAQRGVIILQKDGQWAIEAEQQIDQEEATLFSSLPVDKENVPLSVVNYVARTQETVVINDATEQGKFSQDTYIQTYQPRSVLCLPLVTQNTLVGLIYLENKLTTNAFTLDRLTILNLLSTQAAIGIENARLYASIQASEAKFRTLFEESKDVIFMITPDGVFTEINPACESIFGYSREEMLDMKFQDFQITPVEQEALHNFEQFGSTPEKEVTIRRRDDQERNCLVTASLRRDDAGNLLEIQGIIRDVTAQREAQQEAERAARQEHMLDVQRAVIRELSTPLLPLAEGVLLLPLVGSLDSARINQMTEILLHGVHEHRAHMTILDVTGVPVMDSQVADMLVQAARSTHLLGAQVILTGISPNIAETLVHLGVDLQGIITRRSLQEGIAYALHGAHSSLAFTSSVARRNGNGKRLTHHA